MAIARARSEMRILQVLIIYLKVVLKYRFCQLTISHIVEAGTCVDGIEGFNVENCHCVTIQLE